MLCLHVKDSPDGEREAPRRALALSEQEGTLSGTVEQRLLGRHSLDLSMEPSGGRKESVLQEC